MKRITVFCGSNSGTENIYYQKAYELGKTLAEKNIELVYGGAKVGLMGAVADGVLENNGKAIGVLPTFLKKVEIAQENLSELIWVETMHQRKTRMDELSDGVIMLPGGYGTLDEFFEMLTWAQLGLHKKPVSILNIDGFYNELLSLIEKMVQKGFLKKVNQEMLIVTEDIGDLLKKMENYEAPVVGKWIQKSEV